MSYCTRAGVVRFGKSAARHTMSRHTGYVLLSLLFGLSNVVSAQHLRIFACAIANDSAGAFMGGSSNGSGLYQSDDTGKTWMHLGWSNIKCYSMDMVQSSNGRILYEATGLGVLHSTDYGVTWKQLTDWRISEAMDIAVNQRKPEEIYIATAHGPWQSFDAGQNWVQIRKQGQKRFANRVYISDSAHPAYFINSLSQVCNLEVSWTTYASEDGSYPLVVLLATLENGIYKSRSIEHPVSDIGPFLDCDHLNCVLPKRQIWRLRQFIVTP